MLILHQVNRPAIVVRFCIQVKTLLAPSEHDMYVRSEMDAVIPTQKIGTPLYRRQYIHILSMSALGLTSLNILRGILALGLTGRAQKDTDCPCTRRHLQMMKLR